MTPKEKEYDNKITRALAVGEGMYRPGLTKREYFTGVAMQAYINSGYHGDEKETMSDVAKLSVQMVDILLLELEK